MHRLKSRGIVVLAVIGLFALSGIAMADTEDDTVVNHYIDYDDAFLALNVTSLDYSPDYEGMFEALGAECTLEGVGGDFSISFDGSMVTVNDGGSPAELDCSEFVGGHFHGPNGQTNEGMVMKFLNSIYDGPGRGCVIREFAQMEFDSEDRIQADPGFVAPEPTEEDPAVLEGVEFATFETNCLHGKNQDEDGRGGPPEHVLEKHAEKWGEGGPGKPDHAGGGRP